MIEKTQQSAAFEFLRQFARKRLPVERCEMCAAILAPEHQHLLDPLNRKIACACDACAILFHTQGDTKFKRIPRRIRFLPDFQLTDGQWNSLMMPINMAFFHRSTPHDGRVIAMYPSPAGATESLLTFDTWDEIAADNPVLGEMETDVEALLVNRIGHSRGFTDPEYYIVPIDECYKLVGLIRTHWSGLAGGTEVWREIAEFFTRLKAMSPHKVAENANA
ncbi:MAG TPA: DUF5947 family protein [Bryobacteraceae bacterium]|jgi:hypothetical protein|nr:DUF5947 family protein [Bryobacteraceae bacterium]